MLPTQLYIIPFFVVGRRMTCTIEIRGRSFDDLPFNEDITIFDYDSSRDVRRYTDSIEMLHDAIRTLMSELQLRKDKGWPLTAKQEVFLTRKGPDILWLYDVGFGERASVPTVALDAIMGLSD